MDTIQIPCPKCGRELKLRDRSLLGRKGKCPKCEHTFVLQEPTAVPLEQAAPEPAAVGNGLPWSPQPVNPTATLPRPNASRPQPIAPAVNAPAVSAPISEFGSFGSNDGTAARVKAQQRKNAQRRNVGLAITVVILGAVGGIAFYAVKYAPPKPAPDQADLAQANHAAEAPADPDASPEKTSRTASPTKGKPIELQYIPFGTQVVLNIRPAELWKDENRLTEFRYCIPPVIKLLEEKFVELFKRKPQQIEEAQICIIPGSQGTLPEVAAVIHLVDDAKKSQLLEDFGGERIDDYGHPVYLTGNTAYLIADQRTIAMGPKAQAQEMVNAIVGRNDASDGIDELLPMTDRDRHVTLIFVPRTIRQHATWWFPENLKPFVLRVCDWFGDEVETVSWSFHLTEKSFFSDLLLRNVTGITSSRLERDTRSKLTKLPNELLTTIRMMNPREVGKRKVIGRVPKMSEVCALASTTTHGPRHVQVITPLPERAAPNLALGTLLAWDESTRTDFTKERGKPTPSDEPKLPDLIADRLKLKIDVEFNRTPLQEAYAFIATEIKTKIEIDGDALKAGGFTKNMPQSFKMEKAAVKDIVAKLLEKYQAPDKPSQTMVIVVDEAKKMIIVTTQGFCDQKNLTPYDVFKK